MQYVNTCRLVALFLHTPMEPYFKMKKRIVYAFRVGLLPGLDLHRHVPVPWRFLNHCRFPVEKFLPAFAAEQDTLAAAA